MISRTFQIDFLLILSFSICKLLNISHQNDGPPLKFLKGNIYSFLEFSFLFPLFLLSMGDDTKPPPPAQSPSKTNNKSSNTFSGILKRKGFFFGMYQTCYCELNRSSFDIKKSKNSVKVERHISIKPTTQIQVYENEKTPRFVIQNEGEAEVCLAGETPDEVMSWVVALRSATFHNSITLTMNSFDILSVIGRGFYGKVMLVRMKNTGMLYAIKTVHKSRLISSQKVHTIFNERNILVKSNHPFIVDLVYAFQTDTKFYLVLEYIPGGELFKHVHNPNNNLASTQSCLKIEDIRLYVAEIALAIDYLHGMGIVYRDLKSENILLGADGHIKLTDFGLSKDLSFIEVTSTFCGTIEFIAPEIIRREPYSYKIDWWALGILTYELLFKVTPFFNENRARLFQAITSQEPQFPPGADPAAVDFISRLLIKEPKKRATFESLKDHPFWNGLNFDDVLAKRVKPSFVPPSDGDGIGAGRRNGEYAEEPAADSIASSLGTSDGNFTGFSYSGLPEEVVERLKEADITNSSGILPSNLIMQEELSIPEDVPDPTLVNTIPCNSPNEEGSILMKEKENKEINEELNDDFCVNEDVGEVE
ncbi:AGC family protein kinase [Tritrichomonas foetus]|uniref:AGC family protein kinase n=1 Tax=Tritrichomonas foetus TaxID=1144522 RepID=A0A1J4J8X2_9EUKA|nr:AGC family protein kinase [Tritrichomonas foetus]|eukprot:OHS95634.1 AGC family protein kinase [Tritrichomonas foetus]